MDELERNDRPPTAWVAVAVVLALVAASLVAWRALGGRENQQVSGLLLGASGNVLGHDTARGRGAMWLDIAGPQSSRVDGDRFTAGCAERRAVARSRDACPPNADLDRRGHLFVVRVAKAESQRPLLIEVADPQLGPGQPCRPTSTSSVSGAQACPSDLSPTLSPFTTTFLVKAPDTTPDDPTDNPTICAATFRDQATDASGQPTAERWIRLCAVPASSVQQGDYVVQVRSNADQSAPRLGRRAELDPAYGAGSLERADPAATGDGQNHFALRAQWDGGPDENRGSGLTVNGLDHLVVFMNPANAKLSFPLLDLPTSAAGRPLRLRLFDVGDLATTGPRPTGEGIDVRVAPPSDAQVGGSPLRDFADCHFAFPSDGGDRATPTDGCAMVRATRDRFDGHDIVIDVPVPADYSCESTTSNCSLTVQLDYRGTPNDNVTWSAEFLDAAHPTDPMSIAPTTPARPAGDAQLPR